MLNEVYDLWQACDRSGVDLPIRVPGLDKGKSADGVRFFLERGGAVTRVESVPAEQMKRIRKWERGSGITLPVFNFEPLHELPPKEFADFKKAVDKLAKGQLPDLRPFLRGSHPIRWRSKKIGHLDNAFKKVSADLLKKFSRDETEESDGWRMLLRTVQKLDAKEWLDRLSKSICQFASQDCFPALADLLFHNSSKDKTTTVPVQLEMEGVNTPIYSERAQRCLTRVLAQCFAPTSEEGAEEGEVGSSRGDVYHTGAVWGMTSGSSEKYRQVELPVLGKVSLFYRNVSEKPTSIRYEKGGAIFKVGLDIRMKMMAAVEWLAEKEREGKTWASGKPKKDGAFLLLAYLTKSVDATPEHLAEVFVGPPDEESERAVIKFETVCTDLIGALNGIPTLNDTSRIQVFALHKPDGYRAQIYASESFSQSALGHLAEAWQAHCRAHPPIELPQFSQDKDATPVRGFEPLVPFPYQAIVCLNTIWEKCGNADEAKCESASDYNLTDAFELLRRTGAHPTDIAYIQRMLDLAVRRALPLMGAVGQAMHQVSRRVFLARGAPSSAVRSRLQTRYWPCLLSLLLTRIGYKWETFMKEPAYLIGRFLAQLDRLHALYAMHVSGKEDGLRQLLGNSLMSVSLESPLRAFELAGQRILPYQAWGHSFARGRRSKDALVPDEARATNRDRWKVHDILEDLGNIAVELSNCGIPEVNRAGMPVRVGHEAEPPARSVLDLTDTLKANDRAWTHADPAAKAQMLLGYLALPARKEAATAARIASGPTPPDFD